MHHNQIKVKAWLDHKGILSFDNCGCRACNIYSIYLYTALSVGISLIETQNPNEHFLNYQIDVHCVEIHALIDVLQAVLRWHHHILHYWLLIILHESRASTTDEYTQILVRRLCFFTYYLLVKNGSTIKTLKSTINLTLLAACGSSSWHSAC